MANLAGIATENRERSETSLEDNGITSLPPAVSKWKRYFTNSNSGSRQGAFVSNGLSMACDH
jgi:hypothetical protein